MLASRAVGPGLLRTLASRLPLGASRALVSAPSFPSSRVVVTRASSGEPCLRTVQFSTSSEQLSASSAPEPAPFPSSSPVAGSGVEGRDLCGRLRDADLGRPVQLFGWLQSVRLYGGLVFAVLRDWSGSVQIVWEEGSAAAAGQAEEFARLKALLSMECVVRVAGRLRERPAEQQRAEEPTGLFELQVEELELLNPAEELPLKLNSPKTKEATRLRWRYVDLRRPQLQRNLRLRSQIAQSVRRELTELDFVEVETPILFKPTDEDASGAHEFLVPTRSRSWGSSASANSGENRWFALPQSPQQSKQMLMSGGLDRYFQIARCFRDEGGRADRQPEFTQIDLELSFASQADVMLITERMVRRLLDDAARQHGVDALYQLRGPLLSPSSPSRPPQDQKEEKEETTLSQSAQFGSLGFPVMSYRRAVGSFGSDKPDTRFGFELRDLGPVLLAEEPFRSLSVPGEVSVRGINLGAGFPGSLARNARKELLAAAAPSAAQERRLGPAGLFLVQLAQDGWTGAPKSVSEALERRRPELVRALGLAPGDWAVLGSGSWASVCSALGKVRAQAGAWELAQPRPEGAQDEPALRLHWVVDFPLLERCEHENGAGLGSTHHPFTTAIPADLPRLRELLESGDEGSEEVQRELLGVRAQHYDLVCNGWELGGGSVRIHDPALQRRLLRLIQPRQPGDSEEKLEQQVQGAFGHVLDMLRFGCPPHAGIALGLDRLVGLVAAALDRQPLAYPLRDVIAFPKSVDGNDACVGAPAGLSPAQLQQYGFLSAAPASSTGAEEQEAASKV